MMVDKEGDSVRNEKVLDRVKKKRNIVHTTKTRKANWIGHILSSSRNRNHGRIRRNT